MNPRAAELIRTLELQPHPEGGFYKRVYESSKQVEINGLLRPSLTTISFLVLKDLINRWHRVDGNEVWEWQEGAALDLRMYDAQAHSLSRAQLDTSARGGQLVQVVPAGVWQSARTHGEYTLASCSVTPGFVWAGFEMLDESSDTADRLRAAGGLVA